MEADIDELEIALLNLVLNARDAMPDGGEVIVSIVPYAEHSDRPAEMPPGKLAAVCVADNGAGIPAEIVGRIFEPYFTTKSERGNGLGLSQVYGFAQQSGGTVTVESEVGRETTMCIWLPRVDVDAKSDARHAAAAPQATMGARVLLVDDNPDVAAVAADYLEQCGCSIVRADSGEEAIEKLSSSTDIDMVLSDIVMPGMGGLAFGRWVRNNRPGTPVLLMTGYSNQASAALAEGFSLLSKPYSFDALRTALLTLGLDCGGDPHPRLLFKRSALNWLRDARNAMDPVGRETC